MAKVKKKSVDKKAAERKAALKSLARQAPKDGGSRNPLTRVTRYLKDARGELSKVVWPNRSEIVQSKIVVLVTVVFFSLFIGGLDLIFGSIIRELAGK